MCEAEQQLRKLSFDEEITNVLRTPNKIKFKNSDFQGWEDFKQYSFRTSEKHSAPSQQKNKFKVKSSKFRIKAESARKDHTLIFQNKQNEILDKEKVFTLKMIRLLDQQTLSPNSRKLLTPKKVRKTQQIRYENTSNDYQYQTPTKINRSRQVSLKKLCVSEGLNKGAYSSQRGKKHFSDDSLIQNLTNQEDSSIKIPLSSIIYPLIKSNVRKQFKRIQRFHSFVARTVRK